MKRIVHAAGVAAATFRHRALGVKDGMYCELPCRRGGARLAAFALWHPPGAARRSRRPHYRRRLHARAVGRPPAGRSRRGTRGSDAGRRPRRLRRGRGAATRSLPLHVATATRGCGPLAGGPSPRPTLALGPSISRSAAGDGDEIYVPACRSTPTRPPHAHRAGARAQPPARAQRRRQRGRCAELGRVPGIGPRDRRAHRRAARTRGTVRIARRAARRRRHDAEPPGARSAVSCGRPLKVTPRQTAH